MQRTAIQQRPLRRALSLRGGFASSMGRSVPAFVEGICEPACRESEFADIDHDGFPVASAADDGNVVVNFGLLTGREATQAELDRLALALRRGGAGAEMTITAARRQDYGPRAETVSHQVQVSLAGSPSPPTSWVEAICRGWAIACAEERSVEPLPP